MRTWGAEDRIAVSVHSNPSDDKTTTSTGGFMQVMGTVNNSTQLAGQVRSLIG